MTLIERLNIMVDMALMEQKMKKTQIIKRKRLSSI